MVVARPLFSLKSGHSVFLYKQVGDQTQDSSVAFAVYSTGDAIITADPGQNSQIWTGGDGYCGGGGCGDGGSDGGDGKGEGANHGGAGTGQDVSYFTFRTWTLASGTFLSSFPS